MFENLFYSIKNIIKKQLKIGLISYYYPRKSEMEGGVAAHSFYLSRELAKQGCDVHVFSFGEKDSVRKEYIGDGRLTIHRINASFNNYVFDPTVKLMTSYFIFDNKIINEISKENSFKKFDVIHTHGWLTAGAFISKYFNNIKWVHTFHAVEKNRLKKMSEDEKKHFDIISWIERTVRYADKLIVVSECLKKEVIESFLVKEDKVLCIPNGVDLSLFSPSKEKDEKRVLFVGRFSMEKGVDLLPAIANQVLKKNVKAKFEVVCPYVSVPISLERIGKEFELLEERFPGRFKWHRQFLGNDKIAELYRKCSIYIQPSRYETFGMCVLEAMATGKAVIVSDKGGLPEVVEDAGLIIPLNSREFAKKILFLLDNSKLREKYNKKAIERAKNFSWENIAKRVIKTYIDIKGYKNL